MCRSEHMQTNLLFIKIYSHACTNNTLICTMQNNFWLGAFRIIKFLLTQAYLYEMFVLFINSFIIFLLLYYVQKTIFTMCANKCIYYKYITYNEYKIKNALLLIQWIPLKWDTLEQDHLAQCTNFVTFTLCFCSSRSAPIKQKPWYI